MDFYVLYWLLGIICVPGIIFAFVAQTKVFTSYNKYKQVQASTDKTAEQIAREILDKNDLQNITIRRTSGELSDHYHPKKQEIALSDGVYGSNSVASISIALHEVGHAIQDKENYKPSRIRAALVPIVNFSSILLWPMMLVGLFLNIFASWNSFAGNVFMIVGLVFFFLSILFSLITLPTELDASKRALAQLTENGYLTSEEEITGAKKVLNAAALTYVASLVVAILNFLRFLFTLLILRGDD